MGQIWGPCTQTQRVEHWLLVLLIVVLGISRPSGRREPAQPLGQLTETPAHQRVDRTVRVTAVRARFPCRQPGQHLQPLVDRPDGPAMELPLPPRYAPRMATPLLWMRPDISVSRSILTTPRLPTKVRAVIRLGWPKL